MKKLIASLVVIGFCLSSSLLTAESKVLSNSGETIFFKYGTEFRSMIVGTSCRLVSQEAIDAEAASHSDHLYGLFHAPGYAEEFGMESSVLEGFAGLKQMKVTEANCVDTQGEDFIHIRYKARGEALVLKPIVRKWLDGNVAATISLPLLYDLPMIYADETLEEYADPKWKKCTDSHYSSAIDFSYFYNPYICSELKEERIARQVEFEVSRGGESQVPTPIPTELRDDNGNGTLVVAYFVNGFDEPDKTLGEIKKIRRDSGWKNYNYVNKTLVKEFGFTRIKSQSELNEFLGDEAEKLTLESPVTLQHAKQKRFFATLVKSADGKKYVVRNAVLPTDNAIQSKPLRSFIRFWKEAWENGDSIYFGGHSGDGLSLSMNNLLTNLEVSELSKIRFNQKKTQVVLLDACSSYHHYESVYRKQKSKGLYLLSNGLPSPYETSQALIGQWMERFLGAPKKQNWTAFMKDIEVAQLEAHVNAFYSKADRKSVLAELQQLKAYPTALLNVTLQ